MADRKWVKKPGVSSRRSGSRTFKQAVLARAPGKKSR